MLAGIRIKAVFKYTWRIIDKSPLFPSTDNRLGANDVTWVTSTQSPSSEIKGNCFAVWTPLRHRLQLSYGKFIWRKTWIVSCFPFGKFSLTMLCIVPCGAHICWKVPTVELVPVVPQLRCIFGIVCWKFKPMNCFDLDLNPFLFGERYTGNSIYKLDRGFWNWFVNCISFFFLGDSEHFLNTTSNSNHIIIEKFMIS